MRHFLTSALLLITAAAPAAAQVELKSYANADGYIDVQALTCAQLANTYQEDADYLTVWRRDLAAMRGLGISGLACR
jgi:hypothetical protein